VQTFHQSKRAGFILHETGSFLFTPKFATIADLTTKIFFRKMTSAGEKRSKTSRPKAVGKRRSYFF
jgi:hypothetical protein